MIGSVIADGFRIVVYGPVTSFLLIVEYYRLCVRFGLSSEYYWLFVEFGLDSKYHKLFMEL